MADNAYSPNLLLCTLAYSTMTAVNDEKKRKNLKEEEFKKHLMMYSTGLARANFSSDEF